MTPQQRFFAKVAFGASDCWYWYGSISNIGYGQTLAGKAHRLAWSLFRGPIPAGQKVLHRCDVRSCVNPEHLFLGTQADNVRDMYIKGRDRHSGALGERNGQAKLTRAAVKDMRAWRAASGISYREIGERFGVSTMTAFRAVTGQSWKEHGGDE